MKIFKRLSAIIAVAMAVLFVATACGKPSEAPGPVVSGPVTEFRVGGSVYVGWMPHYYADEAGIFGKWGDQKNIKIKFIPFPDYISSIEAYVAGKIDAVVMTNMEALNMAAAAGVDTTAIIVGDYSNGNDAVLTRNGLTLGDLRDKNVYIVELSVSQYLLERGLAMQFGNRLTVQDMTLVNTSDSDIGPAFIANKTQEVVVTWNPMVLDVLSQVPSVTNIFNSSQIPYEILDIMFVRTDVLQKHPELARALVGAWYETMAVMTGRGPNTEEALNVMAEKSGTTLASYKKQLETTYMYWKAGDAAEFTRSEKLVEVMDLVRRFSYEHGLWTDAKSVDAVGIAFPDGTTLGDPNNVKLRFTDVYMQLAADDKLQ